MEELLHTMHGEYKSNFNILSVMASNYEEANSKVSKLYQSGSHVICRIVHTFKESDISFSDKTIKDGVGFIGNFWITDLKEDYKFYYK